MKRRFAVLLCCAFLLTACQSANLPAVSAPEDAEQLVIYTAHKAEVYQPIVREFEKRTGIWVKIVSGGSGEMLERIAMESDAPQADLMFGGGVESLEAYNQYFEECPVTVELMNDCRLPDSHWLPFSSLPMVFVYNPKLCEAPVGWADLLQERWKGRIAFADPEVSGSSYTALVTLMDVLPQPDTLELFVDNLGGRVLEGSGDVINAVSEGTCLIGVTLEETALKGIANGADIRMVYPAEGTSAVPDGVAMVRGCKHSQNATAFIEFILGDDVQERLSTQFYRRSVRDALPLTTLAYDIGEASACKAELLQRWKQREAKQP